MTSELEGFERFAKIKEGWLGKRLKLPNGTPSEDTFHRIFTALDPKGFVECFIAHVTTLRLELAGDPLRRSRLTAGALRESSGFGIRSQSGREWEMRPGTLRYFVNSP